MSINNIHFKSQNYIQKQYFTIDYDLIDKKLCYPRKGIAQIYPLTP